MEVKESLENNPQKVMNPLDLSLVPPAKTIYAEFVFKTPKKVPFDNHQRKTPIMCTEEIKYNRKSPIKPFPQLCLPKSIKDQMEKKGGRHILSISPEIYKPILPFPILNDTPITILKDVPDKLLGDENPFPIGHGKSEITGKKLNETGIVQIPKENKCETCGKVCKTPAALKSHLITHVDTKPYQCLQCQKYFKSENGVITHLNITHKMIGLRETGNVHQYFRKDLDEAGSSQDPQKSVKLKEVKRRVLADDISKEGATKRVRTNATGTSGNDIFSFYHGFPPAVKAAILADLAPEQSQEKKIIEKVADPLPIDHNRKFGDLNWPCKKCKAILAFKHTFTLHMSYFHSMQVVCDTCRRVYHDEDTLKQHINAVHVN
ncbi:hypothetical protein LOD99_7267 [Oopsacas minuta]|uniref:C2H2-type domain-containing protein n=1 Tax=Oopsacas minuta TaxID=111878 RepID=A0AAV7JV43_9METZ|nr:hypothetical protein LOD99_7267 [Oopsacas minuta]